MDHRYHINSSSWLAQINDENILSNSSSKPRARSMSSKVEPTDTVDFSGAPSSFGDTSSISFDRENNARHVPRLHSTGKPAFNLIIFKK